MQLLLCAAISVVIYYTLFLLQSPTKRTSPLLFLLWRYLMVTPPLVTPPPLLTPPPITFTSPLMTPAPSSSNPTQVTFCWKWVVRSSNEHPTGEWSWICQVLVMPLTDHCWMDSTFIPKSLTRSLRSVDPLCVCTLYCTCVNDALMLLMLLVCDQPSVFTHMMADEQQQLGRHFCNLSWISYEVYAYYTAIC